MDTIEKLSIYIERVNNNQTNDKQWNTTKLLKPMKFVSNFYMLPFTVVSTFRTTLHDQIIHTILLKSYPSKKITKLITFN
jgi:hypothetical protein